MPDSPPDPARRDRFTAVYDTYYHRILGYARRRVRPDDAAEIVAETFAVAWRRFDVVPDGDQALLWLYATARRVLANHRRAERRRAELMRAIENEPVAMTTPALSIESPRVGMALGRLHEHERELLLLVAWEGLDAKDIAAVLGCSRNAVRIRIHRARHHFALELADDDDDLKHPGSSGHLLRARPSGPDELEDSQ
ncbi:MAG TPA: RNA polymerase sigma factor [Gaiellaceae bacterium]|nr:RNA polymerase sigma factor [Gaiellaceae bacterium]